MIEEDLALQELNSNVMETKQIKFKIPDGYEVDKEKSTFQEIILKKIKRVPSLHLENDLLLFRYPEEVSHDTWEKLLRYRKHILKEAHQDLIPKTITLL